MTFDEALGAAKKVEFVQAPTEATTTALVVPGVTNQHTAYNAMDYNPLTVNTDDRDEIELIQLYLDDSWKLLWHIQCVAEDIAKGRGDYLTTFNLGRLNKIVDDIRMLRKKNITLVVGA